MSDDVTRRHLFEVELQTAREHSHRDFLGIGGGKNELDVLRRLFERLQHGIEGMASEHVHFIDHIDLETPLHRRVHGLIQQGGHVVYATIRSSVHFDVVRETVGINGQTSRAFSAGLGSDTGVTVERLGENPADGCLAHPASSGKQPGMVQTSCFKRVRQRPHHVLLPHQGGK